MNSNAITSEFHQLKTVLLVALLAISFPVIAQAQDSALLEEDDQAQHSAEIAIINSVLNRTQPDMVVTSVVPSPVQGLYEVNLQNGQSLYASADGKYFIPGDIYEVRPQGLVNLGELKRNRFRAERIASLDESDMLIFDVIGERKATLTVFTDVDCPYCRKLHADVPQLNSMGIAVRYLAFPRTGLDTETYFKMVSTWCSEDPRATFTSAKRGGSIPAQSCDNPVAEQYQLGKELGVTGTPALVLEDGTLLPGYIPASTLAGYILNGIR